MFSSVRKVTNHIYFILHSFADIVQAEITHLIHLRVFSLLKISGKFKLN